MRGYSTNGLSGAFDGDFQLRHSGTFAPYFSAEESGRITVLGPVAVGTVASSSDPNYLMYVHKGIQTGRIKTLASLADYVFTPTHISPSLVEVEAFVWTHGHLSGVISQAEADAAGGVELTAFTVQLQEKLEELYLHTIALEKRIRELEADNASSHE